MAFGLTIATERATALQNSIQDELTKRGYSTEADPVMAEYITIMLINNKTKDQISSELEDLIGSDFDATFVDWLFEEAAKGAPDAAPPVAETSTSVQRRESPPHLADTARKPPSGPRAGVPLYQQAISQVIPSTSPSGQKRTASARSPSPTGHANKSRRIEGPPTGPRAMQHGGQRSLLERMGGPSRNGHAPYGQDDIQARIDTITNGSPDPNMMMMGGGFPMGGMPGMDMAMTNPLLLQEMMMNQMALMSQMAGAMGIMNGGGGFPMQNMGGDIGMFNGGMNGMQGPMGGAMDGRGRGRGRGGSRGAGRGGRGGQHNQNAILHGANGLVNGGPQALQAPPITPNPAVVAPTPLPAPVATPAPSITPSTSASSQARPAFVPPERPQSPTLCKFSLKCTNPLCRYSHPSPVATPESGVVLSNEACENGKNCKDKDCIKAHVSPAATSPKADLLKPSTYSSPAPPASNLHTSSQTQCRYGAACTRPNCSFSHPSRVPHNVASIPCKFGTACTRSNCPYQHPEGRVLPSSFHRGLSATGPIEKVPTPQTGSIGSASYNKSVTFNKSQSAAELEKKLKDMEEKKNAAEKAVARAEAAVASKKDSPVAISA